MVWVTLFSSGCPTKNIASLQGGLDVQYLTSGYDRGKAAVAKIMQDRHAFVVHRQISLAQGEIVEKQAALGRSAFLS